MGKGVGEQGGAGGRDMIDETASTLVGSIFISLI